MHAFAADNSAAAVFANRQPAAVFADRQSAQQQGLLTGNQHRPKETDALQQPIQDANQLLTCVSCHAAIIPLRVYISV